MISMLTGYYRAYNRLENTFFARNFNSREETYPFVSCDSYALSCEFSFSRYARKEDLESQVSLLEQYSSIFLPTKFGEDVAMYFKGRGKVFKKIVLGDDDETLDETVIKKVSEIAVDLYGINIKQNSE